MSVITSLSLRVPRSLNQFTSYKYFSVFRNAAYRNVEENGTEGESDNVMWFLSTDVLTLTNVYFFIEIFFSDTKENEFRVLNVSGTRSSQRSRRPMGRKSPILPPRSNQMPVNQDWPSVWPTAKTFHPASVPLPLHQGWVEPGVTPPGKFANAELMKIPNFLHLTPPAIKKHCEALKRNLGCNMKVQFLEISLLLFLFQNSAQIGQVIWKLKRR